MKNVIFSEILRALPQKNLFSQVIDILLHKIRINTSPIDYYRYRFYQSDKTWDEKSRYVGKRCSNFYPYQSNSVQFVPVFDNKYIFSTMLSGFQIPHPRLIATIGNDYQIKSFKQFEELINNNTIDMVLKPLDGSGGRGVIVLKFKGDHHCTLEGTCSAKDIWQQISPIDNTPIPYLIEESVQQDPLVSSLYPHSLNTIRVITIKTNNKEWKRIGSWMRIGQRGQIDNLGAGGIHLGFDDQGRSCFAYDWLAKRTITRHPITEANLIGFHIPQYFDAISLALQASEKFSFMGTIGWDVGLSDRGPIIIEGNIFYDCLYWQVHGQGPLIPSKIASQLPRQKFMQRWDKTKLHPRVNRKKIIA